MSAGRQKKGAESVRTRPKSEGYNAGGKPLAFP